LFFKHSSDSLEIYSKTVLDGVKSEIVVVSNYAGEKHRDTLTHRFRQNELTAPVKLVSLNDDILVPGTVPLFMVHSAVVDMDLDLIHLMNLDDSTEISSFEAFNVEGSINIYPEEQKVENLLITLDEGAVQTVNGPSKKLERKVSFAKESDFGILNVSLTDYETPLIVELLLRNKVVDRIIINDGADMAVFEHLFPGEYSFRVIRDTNGNEKWDVGEYDSLTQPETVDTYSKLTKVRANWTIDVTLTPTH